MGEELPRCEGTWRVLGAAGVGEEGFSSEMAPCVQGQSWAADTHRGVHLLQLALFVFRERQVKIINES